MHCDFLISPVIWGLLNDLVFRKVKRNRWGKVHLKLRGVLQQWREDQQQWHLPLHTFLIRSSN
jgi:hypothetical protein